VAALAKGDRWRGEKGRGGPVLGAPRGGAGGASGARHVTRRREGPGQRHAPAWGRQVERVGAGEGRGGNMWAPQHSILRRRI
jgi:hypothetical protein